MTHAVLENTRREPISKCFKHDSIVSIVYASKTIADSNMMQHVEHVAVAKNYSE